MKQKLIAVALCLSLVLSFSLFSKNKAYADPFTASQIASASYALLNGWGISFTTSSATAQGMNGFMTQQVESYVNSKGGSIADVFVGKMAVDVAGKLVVAYDLYNSIVEFKDWLVEKFDLGLEDSKIGEVVTDSEGNIIPIENIMNTGSGIKSTGFSCVLHGYSSNCPSGKFYCNGTAVGYIEQSSTKGWGNTIGWKVYYANGWKAELLGQTNQGNYLYSSGYLTGSALYTNPQSLDWNGANYYAPTVLYPDKEWTGTIGGYSEPDTNLNQLLGNIDQAVADNNLVVDGEVKDIDPPQPGPTPGPIDPDTPLQNVPWEGLDNNLQQLYEQGLEEIGTIGEAKDAITDAVVEQTGVLEDAIADNAGVVSGAIDQAVSDVQSAIGEQTVALDESLTATAEGVETIVEAIEDEQINWQKFDLKGLFPFCIPFDIYNMLNALDASPVAPHVQLPFVIQSIGFSYLLDLDFAAFDPVATIMRQMELICYGLALAWATSKVIKW